ncbi:MAG: hypothetical protein CMD53_04340 [Gammaproteobacteria bacterium]|nr:hypothetical protein [Gammaproteobacteria bacterium]HJL95402.1 DUF6285 domain-containing protein [SAR86 cluster bacterium]|tara:strand:- start:10015 stop:10377 length:363 start_codon:yes stop_codon:yes gene_type:complete
MIFDRPTSSELIKAVIDFLETKIKHELPAHLAFKIRITNNVLGMVQREIDQGEQLSEEVIEVMSNLINSDEATTKKLSDLIKNGDLDLTDIKLKELLVLLSKNKIAIDNPNYSTYKKLIK